MGVPLKKKVGTNGCWVFEREHVGSVEQGDGGVSEGDCVVCAVCRGGGVLCDKKQRDGHTGARTQDHSVISTALYRLSYTTSLHLLHAKHTTSLPTTNTTTTTQEYTQHAHHNKQKNN